MFTNVWREFRNGVREGYFFVREDGGFRSNEAQTTVTCLRLRLCVRMFPFMWFCVYAYLCVCALVSRKLLVSFMVHGFLVFVGVSVCVCVSGVCVCVRESPCVCPCDCVSARLCVCLSVRATVHLCLLVL